MTSGGKRKGEGQPAARRQHRRTPLLQPESRSGQVRDRFHDSLRCAWHTHECANDNDQMYRVYICKCNLQHRTIRWRGELAAIRGDSTRRVIDRLSNITRI